MTEEVIEQISTEPVVTGEIAPEVVVETPAEAISSTEPELPLGDEPKETPAAKAAKPKEERTVPVKVMLDRVGAKDALLNAAERRAAEAEALVARLQNQEQPQTPPTAANIDELVKARAADLKMKDDRDAIVKAGTGAFGEEYFNEAAGIAAACGCVSNEFVSDVLAVDREKAHEIYVAIAKDTDFATKLAAMDSRSRIAALTRMTMTTPKTEPAKPMTLAPVKQVSKAPAPPPPIEPSASKVTDWRADTSSDEDFDRGFRETMAKRSQRR